jgi:peptidoglycan/xylan/chitin deacetylase (PgdA/CDA1 family)
VDDGYFDFAANGIDAFAAFDCPVTLFVVPGIIESGSWFWWDQVEWAFMHTERTQITLQLDETVWGASWLNADQRRAAMKDLVERLKGIPDALRRVVIADLPTQLQVTLPLYAPATHRVLGWSELRALEARGVRIGPHTMTHPVLARCTEETAAFEIEQSTRRVFQEMKNPSRIFCYPNGRVGDFGEREIALLRKTPVQSAVSAEPGIATPRQLPTAAWRWQVPRFTFESTSGMTARVLFL